MGLVLASLIGSRDKYVTYADAVAENHMFWLEDEDDTTEATSGTSGGDDDQSITKNKKIYLIRLDDVILGYKPSIKSAQRFCKGLMKRATISLMNGTHRFWWSTQPYNRTTEQRRYQLKSMPYNDLMKIARVEHVLTIAPTRQIEHAEIVEDVVTKRLTRQYQFGVKV